MCWGIQNSTYCVESFLVCSENTPARSMQTHHIIATLVTLKWNCFSAIYNAVLLAFVFYSMQISVLALIPSLYQHYEGCG